MRTLRRAVWLLLLATVSRATTFTGGDWGGASLRPANGDVLSGTFTNVSDFSLSPGATVFIAAGIPFAVYAQTITIAGTLDGVGRGENGGGGGVLGGGVGTDGFGIGGGTHALAGNGGGGGGGAGVGGHGAGYTPITDGTGGKAYGSTGTLTIPLSADDALLGSGGGGGGGGSATAGSSGGAGGGSIYMEASSITISGFVDVSGSTAAPSAEGGATGNHPGAGGGGGGGTLLIRALADITVSGRLNANGGGGGNASMLFPAPNIDPGGGGSGGRIKLFARSTNYSLVISTHGGVIGGSGGFGGTIEASSPTAGSTGTASFGIIASSPTQFAASSVYVTSVSWTWSAPASFGDGPTVSRYRIFPGGTVAPLSGPESDTSTAIAGSTVTGLSPNTTYFRFVTAYTDWGDSHPSNGATVYTQADLPGAAAQPFPSNAATSLTFAWTSGAAGNPSYTQYEVSKSSVPGFGVAVSTSFVVGTSSVAPSLLPNTSYYFRARAVNLAGVATEFSATQTTATIAAVPASLAFTNVFVTSASVSWGANGNPSDTRFRVDVSTDNFFTISTFVFTTQTSAAFSALLPGQLYFFRASGLNRHDVQSAYSASVSAVTGNTSDLTSPSTPGTPAADVQFSYDGTLTFAWTPATHSVGILDYHLIVGSLPGQADVLNDTSVLVASRSISGLVSGRSYYAQVRARANNGVYSNFSSASGGTPVFNAATTPAIAKPYSWPSPLDPRQGPAQIGFFMPAAGSVHFRIFTLQGRLVQEWSQDFPSGNQIATWNGRNGAGSMVAPGGYIVMIEKKPGGVQKMKLAVLY